MKYASIVIWIHPSRKFSYSNYVIAGEETPTKTDVKLCEFEIDSLIELVHHTLVYQIFLEDLLAINVCISLIFSFE